MSKTFLKNLSKRRSIYTLGKEIKLDDYQIEQLLMESLKIAPSSFNSQSARLVLLLGNQHLLLWRKTLDILKKIIPEKQQKTTIKKIECFSAAYGTVLFFEDEDIVQSLKKDYPTYQDRFDSWAEQGNAMLQYIVWTLFAEENIGASLQHYNPLIDETVKKQWEIPKSWRLIAQMPFGNKLNRIPPREIISPEKRMRIFT